MVYGHLNNMATYKVGQAPWETQQPKSFRVGEAPWETPQNVSEENTYGAFFPSKSTDTPIQAGLKAAGNLPSSAFNLAKSLGTAVLNPIDTVKGIGKVAIGGVQKLIPGEQGMEQDFNAFTNILKDRYGSLDALAKTATNDPFGFGTDIVTLVGGGATLAGKSAQATQLASKVGKAVTNPVTKTAQKVGQGVTSTAKYATSQATGLNPETITQLLKNPNAFKAENLTSRSEITESVKNALDSRLSELSGLGKEYGVLRETPQIVTIPPNTIRDVLGKYGVKLDENNRIVTSVESRPLSVGDKNAIQDFIDNYGNQKVLSSNAFLNVREALSNLSKYDASKTNISTTISRDLRSVYDDAGKTQIRGLKELDAQYAPERQLLGQLKKDIFTPQGELKDGAISKIANITGAGKEKVLARMKEIVPDIDQRVRVLKAVEDIERSSGIKVGTYARGAGAAIGVGTGNIPLLIGAILAQPQIAVPLLKGAGYVGAKAAPILNTLRTIANDINNFKLPTPLIDADTGGLKVGLSVKNIAKNISIPEKGTIRDFVDYVNGAYKPDAKTLKALKNDAQDIASKYGFSSALMNDKALAKQFGEYLDSVNFDKKLIK